MIFYVFAVLQHKKSASFSVQKNCLLHVVASNLV